MDPITTAILAALPSLAADTLKSSVKDAYEGLTSVIRRKWGHTAPISKAISAVEKEPDSKAQAAVLDESVGAVRASEDTDVLQALHILIEQMKAHDVAGETTKIRFTMNGGAIQGVAVAESLTIGSMTFGSPPAQSR